MKKLISVSAAILLILLTFCSKPGLENPKGNSNTTSLQNNSTNGIRSAIPAYYDSNLLKILFVEFSATAEAQLITHNNSLNFIYRSDPGLPNHQPFISVIDAIPGDGMNPIWREVQIRFNQGFTPRQLFSDNGVFAAAFGVNPEITLDTMNEVYWCPIVGAK